MSQIALRRFYTNSPHKFAQLYSILEQISEILGYSMCGREAKGLELNRRISDLFSCTEWKKDCLILDTLGDATVLPKLRSYTQF